MVTGLDAQLLVFLWGINAAQPDLQFLALLITASNSQSVAVIDAAFDEIVQLTVRYRVSRLGWSEGGGA